MSTDYVAGYLTGRCANGAQRDSGTLYHALPVKEYMGGLFPSSVALCGATFGRRSAGWNAHDKPDHAITCPKCLKKIAKAQGEVAK